MKISFVVAVYRNEKAISKTYEKIINVLKTDLPEYEYEIVFVDDGSDDGSLDEAISLKEKDSCIKVVTFTRNFGQMAAMIAGFREAKGDAVINISADLQDPAALIPKMVEHWSQGSEIVICYRTDRADSLISKMVSNVAYWFLRLSIPQIPKGGFDFVLMDRKVMDEFNAIDVRHRFFQGDLLWTGFRSSYIPYVRMKRTIGESQYNLSKKLKNFLDAFLDASYLSIRFISLCGILTSVLGLIYSLTVIYAWSIGETPFPGWSPIMIAIMLVGGLIMVMLGVIGEYVWRIYEEVRKKPNYIIRRIY
jgi:dolichol-phosphate mannosyltransferase